MPAEPESLVSQRIEEVEDTFRVLSEFGVFDRDEQHIPILEAIAVARILAEEDREAAALHEATRGELALNKILFLKGRLWRCVFLHQLPLFTYHILFMLILLNIATGWLGFVAQQFSLSAPIPVAVLVAGGLGAILRGLWFLWFKVSRRQFRLQFTLAQLAAPWVGMLLGVFAFLLIKAGILLMEGSGHRDGKTSVFELAICFFAGYKWESLLDWVESVKLRSSSSANSGASEAQ